MVKKTVPSILQAIGNTPLVHLNKVVPPLLNKTYYDEARAIDEAEARQMAWRLAREEGIFAGTSSGMNVLGACLLARELGPGHTVVTVAVDSGLKYLAGDLFGQEDL